MLSPSSKTSNNPTPSSSSSAVYKNHLKTIPPGGLAMDFLDGSNISPTNHVGVRDGSISPSPGAIHSQSPSINIDVPGSSNPSESSDPLSRTRPPSSSAVQPALQGSAAAPGTNGLAKAPPQLLYDIIKRNLEQRPLNGEAFGSRVASAGPSNAEGIWDTRCKRLRSDPELLVDSVETSRVVPSPHVNCSKEENPRDIEIRQLLGEGGKRRIWEALTEINSVIGRYADSLLMPIQQFRDCALRELGDGQIDLDTRHAYDVVQGNLMRVCCTISPEIGHGGPRLAEEANPIAEPGDGDTSPWRAWRFSYPATYTSTLVRRVVRLSHIFPPYILEVADYCISGGATWETLFRDRRGTRLYRADFRTMDHHTPVNHAIVTGFAVVLNNFRRTQRLTSLLCLNTIRTESEHLTVGDIVNSWSSWLNNELLKLRDASYVYIPVDVDGEFMLVVVNFMDSKIQCIATNSRQGGRMCSTKGRLIGSAFLVLLQNNQLWLMVTRFQSFHYEFLTPSWSNGQRMSDQGICVLNMMERFEGSPNDLEGLSLQKKKKKRQLRLSYMCIIALCYNNRNRMSLLEGCRNHIRTKEVAASR